MTQPDKRLQKESAVRLTENNDEVLFDVARVLAKNMDSEDASQLIARRTSATTVHRPEEDSRGDLVLNVDDHPQSFSDGESVMMTILAIVPKYDEMSVYRLDDENRVEIKLTSM